ncbi:putative Polyadenylation factor subunit [Operophtera brumata]|uniref:Putative Polyadenylation factor subunit n=1 Tax=Operophtera brumata TaxID=104452 RepID=A0A0L7LTN7_OPEBR|nr:putative Polyadenylation factor subunit [Operophtera brumata]
MSLKIESEVKLESEPCVLAWDNKLFSYDANLTPGTSWSAHAVQIFAIAAGGGKVYSSSNDGGVRVWTAEGQKITELPHNEVDIAALTISGTHVVSGDEDGNARYNVLEEVKSVQYSPPFMFTVRDLYVTVTEIQPEESKTRFVTRHSMEGRAPIKLLGNWLLVTAKGGNSLRLHHATVDKEFKLMHEVRIESDQLEAAGDIDVGGCINALVASSNCVYAAVTGGRLTKIKAV